MSAQVIAERMTSDGYAVCFWDDGAITSANGVIAVHARRERWSIRDARWVNEWIKQDLAFYAWDEIPALFKRGMKAVDRNHWASIAQLREWCSIPAEVVS